MFDLKILQPGDCILFKGKGFISRGIRWFTDSEWNHVVIYVGGGNNYIVEAVMDGVEKNEILPLLKKAEKFCVRRIPDLTVENSELMKAKAYSLMYEPYDKLQFAGLAIYNLLRKIGIKASFLVPNKRDSIICSELYAVCALTISIKFKKKISLVTPDVLGKSDILTTVYEGSYGE